MVYDIFFYRGKILVIFIILQGKGVLQLVQIAIGPINLAVMVVKEGFKLYIPE